MHRLYIYALTLLALTMSASAQSADPLDFAARFERTPAIPAQNGQPAVPEKVFLKWESVPGYRDVLESTTDLHTWAPLFPPLCGYGQTWSVYVPDAGTSSATGTGTPTPQYNYSQRRFADGTILLTWNSGDLAFRKKFHPASDWATLAWPGAISYRKTDPEPPLVPYRVLIMTLSAHPLANPSSFADTPNLTPDAQNRLDRLLALHDELETHIANTPPPPGPEEIGTASDGQRAVYRVRREMLDADDDLLNDCQEYTWGFSDENNPDSDGDSLLDILEDFDGDGSSNVSELAFATDIVSQSSVHVPAITDYTDAASHDQKRISFRYWQDIRKPYRYQVQESNYATGPDFLWHDVNHYTNLLTPLTQAGPSPGMDILSVRANLRTDDTPYPFLRVRVDCAWPPYHLKHPPGPVHKADWRAHNNAHVEALIPGNEFGRNLFDTYNPFGPCKWARWCWTNQLDYTGVSFNQGLDFSFNPGPYTYTATNSVGLSGTGQFARWSSDAEITMITPVHGILAGHILQNRPPLSSVVFHDRQGQPVVRTILATLPETRAEAYYDDIAIVRLDSPVPEGIKVYKLFEVSSAPGSPGLEFRNAKVISTTREMEAFPLVITDVWSDLYMLETCRWMPLYPPPGISDFYKFQPRYPANTLNRGVYGDSSGPSFMFYKGEQILLGHTWYPAEPVAISFYSCPAVRSKIEALISDLNAIAPSVNYSIQTVSIDP